MASLRNGTYNVRDFGAKGIGRHHDDTAYIQATVDWTLSANRGTIYFPVGTYWITSPIRFRPNLNIALRGEPGATIWGEFNNFLLTRVRKTPLDRMHSIESLRLLNTHKRGRGIALHGCVGRISNCYISAWRGIETYNSQSVLIDTCTIAAPRAAGRASVGIMAGSATTVTSLTVSGYEHGIRHHNVGLIVHGGHFEANTVGIMVGMDENGDDFRSTGFDIASVSMEANRTGIYVTKGTGGAISSVSIGGDAQMDYGLRLGWCRDVVVQSVVVDGAQGFTRAGIAVEVPTRTTFIGVRSVPPRAWSLPATRRSQLTFV